MTCAEFEAFINGPQAPWEVDRGVRAAVAAHAVSCPNCAKQNKATMADLEVGMSPELKALARMITGALRAEDLTDPEFRQVIDEAKEKQ